MSAHRFFLSHPIRGKKIKLAVGLRCELCGTGKPPDYLEIHTFADEDPTLEIAPADLEGSLLVLCSRCHHDLHAFDTTSEQQELLVRERPVAVRDEIRKILVYVPRPYTPPETDMEEAFREACTPRFRFGV